MKLFLLIIILGGLGTWAAVDLEHRYKLEDRV